MDLLYLILDSVKALNVTAQKAVIRSVVNCLLDDGSTLLAKDKTRCLFVLLQNPLFVSQSTYTILAHLLQQVRVRPWDYRMSNIDNRSHKCRVTHQVVPHLLLRFSIYSLY